MFSLFLGKTHSAIFSSGPRSLVASAVSCSSYIIISVIAITIRSILPLKDTQHIMTHLSHKAKNTSCKQYLQCCDINIGATGSLQINLVSVCLSLRPSVCLSTRRSSPNRYEKVSWRNRRTKAACLYERKRLSFMKAETVEIVGIRNCTGLTCDAVSGFANTISLYKVVRYIKVQ